MCTRAERLPASAFFADFVGGGAAGLSAALDAPSFAAAASPLPSLPSLPPALGAAASLPLSLPPSLAPSLAPSPASLVASAASLGASASGRSARLRLLSLSPLKSVSYQPPPLRRNTGADIRRCSCDLPQWGHFFSGGSVIFCIASRSCPQFLH